MWTPLHANLLHWLPSWSGEELWTHNTCIIMMIHHCCFFFFPSQTRPRLKALSPDIPVFHKRCDLPGIIWPSDPIVSSIYKMVLGQTLPWYPCLGSHSTRYCVLTSRCWWQYVCVLPAGVSGTKSCHRLWGSLVYCWSSCLVPPRYTGYNYSESEVTAVTVLANKPKARTKKKQR